jgi:uncharacterized protein YdaU (DUF1376 family)
MSKDPAFLFYVNDFLSGVLLMSFEERGKFITLLCLQHQQGHISEDDMFSICSQEDKRILKKFKKDADGFYYNERLDEEKAKRDKFITSQRTNGAKGGRPKKVEKNPNETRGFCLAKPNGNPSENENIDINIINSIYLYWNSKNIIVHKELNKNTQEAVLKALETYSEEQIKTCIDRYAKVLNDANYFWGYKWTLQEFLTRKEGISAFTDEGSKWCSYQAFLKKPCGKGQNIESTFETDDFFQSALERSNKKMRERLGKK